MRFSVITINKNNRNGLQRTLESVINQNFKNFEYIIIDGNSSDGSGELLKGLKIANVRVIVENDEGIYHAMNKGLNFACGEYVIFLNSGDFFIDNQVLRKVNNEILENHGHDCYYGIENKVDDNGRSIIKNVNINDNLFFLLHNSIPHQASFWDAKVLKSLGGFDSRFKIIGDYVLLYKALVLGYSFFKIDVIVDVFQVGGLSNNPKYKYLHKKDLVLFRKYYLRNIIREMSFLYWASKLKPGEKNLFRFYFLVKNKMFFLVSVLKKSK